MSLIDSHCHLDDEQFNGDREQTIERALEAGVTRLVAVGTGDGPPDLEAGLRLAETYAFMDATAGIHPHAASKTTPEDLRRLRELLDHPKVIAAGEIGLDYHYNFSPPERQRAIFTEQLEMARDARKPVIIHTREAWADTLQLLREHWQAAGLPGIMHCFSGGPEEARQVVAMGFYVSFAGVLTFPKTLDIQQAARLIPADRILVETDAPYLAPVPHRGKRNEPAFVVETAARLAALRGVSAAEIALQTTANFQHLFASALRQHVN